MLRQIEVELTGFPELWLGFNLLLRRLCGANAEGAAQVPVREMAALRCCTPGFAKDSNRN